MLKIGGRYVEQKPFPRDSGGSRHAALFLIAGYRHRHQLKNRAWTIVNWYINGCVGGGAGSGAREGLE